MKFGFLKFCIVLCLLLAFVLFVSIEYNFPMDVIYYVSNRLNQSVFNTKLWLQAVSLVFLWFACLFGLILFSETPTKSKNNTVSS